MAISGGFWVAVRALEAFAGRKEQAVYEANLLDGFWSPNKYYGFLNTIKYEEEKVVLDKYTIIEPTRTWAVYITGCSISAPGIWKENLLKAGLP